MSPLGGERTAVQNPLLRYAQEAGWIHLPREEALRLRHGEGSTILLDVLVEQLQHLNPGVVDHPRAVEVARRLSRVAPTIVGNLDAWEFLVGRKTVAVPEERRERNVRLLDPARIDANTFHVTDEFAFDNGAHRCAGYLARPWPASGMRAGAAVANRRGWAK